MNIINTNSYFFTRYRDIMRINNTLLFTRLKSNTKNQDNDQNIPVDKIMTNFTKQYGRTCDNIFSYTLVRNV